MWSSSQGRLESVATLLTAGAKVNKGDNDGVTALMWASGSEVSGYQYQNYYSTQQAQHLFLFR